VESAAPSREQLREQAALVGVTPTEDDLQAVLGFLEVILPALAEVEDIVAREGAPGGDLW
jgi:hypothetical protein